MLLLLMAAVAAEGVREVAADLITHRAMVQPTPAETIEMAETIEIAGVAKAVAVVETNRLRQIAIVAARTMWITAVAVAVAASRLSTDRTDSSRSLLFNRSPLYRTATAQAIGLVTATTMAIVHNWPSSSGPCLNCNRLSNYNSCIYSNSSIYRSSSSNNNIK
jgi:hypothetical protein